MLTRRTALLGGTAVVLTAATPTAFSWLSRVFNGPHATLVVDVSPAVSSAFHATIQRVVDGLPNDYCVYLVRHGFQVRVVRTLLEVAGEENNVHTLGLTSFLRRVVYLPEYVVLSGLGFITHWQPGFTLCHEFGHMFLRDHASVVNDFEVALNDDVVAIRESDEKKASLGDVPLGMNVHFGNARELFCDIFGCYLYEQCRDMADHAINTAWAEECYPATYAAITARTVRWLNDTHLFDDRS